jgi:hypothetical protein
MGPGAIRRCFGKRLRRTLGRRERFSLSPGLRRQFSQPHCVAIRVVCGGVSQRGLGTLFQLPRLSFAPQCAQRARVSQHGFRGYRVLLAVKSYPTIQSPAEPAPPPPLCGQACFHRLPNSPRSGPAAGAPDPPPFQSRLWLVERKVPRIHTAETPRAEIPDCSRSKRLGGSLNPPFAAATAELACSTVRPDRPDYAHARGFH